MNRVIGLTLVFICFYNVLFCNDSLTLKVIEQSIVHTNNDDYHKAIDILATYLASTDKKDNIAKASIYHKIGVNYYLADQLDEALMNVNKALSIRINIFGKQNTDTQKSLFLRVAIYRYLGRLEESLIDLKQNIEFTEQHQQDSSRSILIDRYDELGNLYLLIKNYHEAIFYWEKVNDYRTQNLDWSNPEVYHIKDQLATAYKNIETYDKALLLFEEAIQFYEKSRPVLHSDLCIAYNNLALTYKLIGEVKIAQEYFQKAVESCQKAEDKITLLEAYTNQVENFTTIKNYPAAKEAFNKAIALSSEISNTQFNARLYNNNGVLEQAKGNLESALKNYNTAIKILVPELKNRADQVLPNPHENNIQSKAELLLPLSNKAKTLVLKNDLEAALATYESIDQLLTVIRLDYQGGNSKFFLLNKSTNYYEQAISIALKLYEDTQNKTYLEKAYQFNAKNKSIVLLDALQDESAKSFAGLPESVLKEEKEWKKNIHTCETIVYELQSKKEESLKLYSDSLFQLKEGYKKFIEALERDYPDYYELKYAFSKPPTVAKIQHQLAEGTLLLEYFLGDERSYIFAISKHDFQIHKIENTNQLLDDLHEISHFLRRPSSTSLEKDRYLDLAYKVYQKLIFPTIEKQSSIQQLLLIPDGSLAQISFESLLYETSNLLQTSTPFLLQKYAISYLYSSSFLFLDQKENKAAARFGGFGIEYDDATLESVQDKSIIPTRSIEIALRSMGKLTYSDDEVLAIAGLLDGATWINEAATKDVFLEQAARFRILHLAMHGSLDEEQPLQSALIFTKTNENNDHFLRAGELYNLKLNADMVVLSACNTGAGQINKGEGVRSLARAFQYAGASSLVASLWSAPDQTTKDITISFYNYLKKGYKKNIALQKAKLDYLENPNTSPEYAHPNYWAHLVAIGEMEALKLDNNYWLWLVGGFSLLLLLILMFRKRTI